MQSLCGQSLQSVRRENGLRGLQSLCGQKGLRAVQPVRGQKGLQSMQSLRGQRLQPLQPLRRRRAGRVDHGGGTQRL